MGNELVKKICLGTAQFGLDYGIANTGGKIPPKEIFEILEQAKREGVDTLDTSSAYGDSESVLGRYPSAGNCKIISKMSLLDFKAGDIKDFAQAQITKTLTALGTKELYGYLIQHFSSFRQNLNVWDAMTEFKKRKTVRYIGFSLYKPEELEFLFKNNIAFDLVQIPYSIFDRRFEPYFEILKECGVQIFVRSVFLQGLIFVSDDKLVGSLSGAKTQLRKLQELSQEYKIATSAICLNFPFLDPLVDKVVIGVDSLAQLKDNLDSLKMAGKVSEIEDYLKDVCISDEDIFLPSRWE